MNDRRGFTLLELLMVVIIIGILASIALPQYFRVTERARIGEAQQVLASIRGSQLRFRAQNPANLYADTAGLASLDIAAPTMLNWDTLAVSGTGALSDVCLSRNGGTNDNDVLSMDLDTGRVCSGDAGSALDWGLPAAAAVACGNCP